MQINDRYVTSLLLVPFGKHRCQFRILPSSFTQEYPSAKRRAAHQGFSVCLAAARPGVLRGMDTDATWESAGQAQVAPFDSRPSYGRLPYPACLPALAPITHGALCADFLQESVQKGELSIVRRVRSPYYYLFRSCFRAKISEGT
jgi:hypothetical protein